MNRYNLADDLGKQLLLIYLINCYTHFITDSYRVCFDIVASKLDGNSLFRLGIKLKLPDNVIDEIYNRNTNNYRKIYQILTSWRENAGQHANINDIINILEGMQKKIIADEIIAKLDSL